MRRLTAFVDNDDGLLSLPFFKSQFRLKRYQQQLVSQKISNDR